MKSFGPLVTGFLLVGIAVLGYGLYMDVSQPILRDGPSIVIPQTYAPNPSSQQVQQVQAYMPAIGPPEKTLYAQTERVFDRKPEQVFDRAPESRDEQVYEGRSQHGPYCDGHCEYAERANQLSHELCEAKEKHDRREQQWNAYYNRTKNFLNQRGIEAPRRGDERNPPSGAVNNGVYGEGRPGTGDYGQSRPNSFGQIKVNNSPCANCNSNMR